MPQKCSSGRPKSEISLTGPSPCLSGHTPPGTPGNLFLPLSIWWLPTTLDLRLHHAIFPSHAHMASSSACIRFPCFSKNRGTCICNPQVSTAFRVHRDNPGQTDHRKIFYSITSAKSFFSFLPYKVTFTRSGI